MHAAPTGEVTFLFTDVEGSTLLWERSADDMERALAEHDRRLRHAIGERRGYVFTTAGDSFAVAFSSPADALAAAVTAQRSLREPCEGLELRVRMGLHTDVATQRDGDYFGAAVNRCARLMSAGHGGQILVSGATERLVRPGLPDDLALDDCGEHRLKDLLRPERIFQVRHPDLDDGFPPLRTLTGPGIDLPVQLTSFVGREQELSDVRALLVDLAHRLVTLTGSGGAGKTRLAYQAAAESIDEFPDGIRAVELEPASGPAFVHDAIAVAVGASDVPDVPLIETIAERIGTQRMLLVLDNSEHIADVVAETARSLLVACPNLQLLATSRQPLKCAGEVVYRVPSLSLPDQPDGRSPDEAYLAGVREFDAVQLFTERAALVQPDFEVGAENVVAVVAICRRLDGIPLALELAAARLRVLSPSQIAERLDERFTLLGSPAPGGFERHRTLAATIEWSYDHLSDEERSVLRRSSVFPASFGLDAAEFVCTGVDIERLAVLDLISGLVDQSMLVAEEATGVVRYRLLETIRQYGADRLADAGEHAATATAHATYCAELGEHLQGVQRAGDIGVATTRLDQEMEHVRSALRFALDAGRVDLAARIVGSVGYLWYVMGLFREGIDWCRELFDADPELPDELLAAALHASGTLLGSWARPAEGAEMIHREVELRRRIGDPVRLAAALNNLGNLQCDLGQLEAGERTLRETIDVYRSVGEPATMPLASLGYSYKDSGRYPEASDLFAQALDEAAAADDEYGIALARTGIGECAVHDGRHGEARRELDHARDGFRSLGVQPGAAYAEFLLALVDLAEGATGDGRRRLAEALVDPDAHWYEATKYWILQVASRALTDPYVGAQLLGVAARHHETAQLPPPAWVQHDFDTGRAELTAALGEERFAAALAEGRRLPTRDAVTLASDALDEPGA